MKEEESARKPADLCREYGISHATFYIWRKKYGGMEVNQALKAALSKNW